MSADRRSAAPATELKTIALPEHYRSQKMDVLVGTPIKPMAVYSFSVDPRERPNQNPSGNHVIFPVGHLLYFAATSGKTWSDSDNGSRIDAQGFPYPDEEEYVDEAQRGQLIGHCNWDNGGILWCGYNYDKDTSLGGTRAYVNDLGRDATLWWHMNDNWNYYDGNQGYMNVSIVVRPQF